MNDGKLRFGVKQTGTDTLTLIGEGGRREMKFARPDADHLELSGDWNATPLRVRLKRVPSDFALTSRGFHWVNEVPFNL